VIRRALGQRHPGIALYSIDLVAAKAALTRSCKQDAAREFAARRVAACD